jgi:hypothetical protein
MVKGSDGSRFSFVEGDTLLHFLVRQLAYQFKMKGRTNSTVEFLCKAICLTAKHSQGKSESDPLRANALGDKPGIAIHTIHTILTILTILTIRTIHTILTIRTIHTIHTIRTIHTTHTILTIHTILTYTHHTHYTHIYYYSLIVGRRREACAAGP